MVERHWFERNHEQGIFAQMMAGLAAEHGEKTTVMIPLGDASIACQAMDATYLNDHRTATSMAAKVRRIRKRSRGSFSRPMGAVA